LLLGEKKKRAKQAKNGKENKKIKVAHRFSFV
jgi:hypothetical protein